MDGMGSIVYVKTAPPHQTPAASWVSPEVRTAMLRRGWGKSKQAKQRKQQTSKASTQIKNETKKRRDKQIKKQTKKQRLMKPENHLHGRIDMIFPFPALHLIFLGFPSSVKVWVVNFHHFFVTPWPNSPEFIPMTDPWDRYIHLHDMETINLCQM